MFAAGDVFAADWRAHRHPLRHAGEGLHDRRRRPRAYVAGQVAVRPDAAALLRTRKTHQGWWLAPLSGGPGQAGRTAPAATAGTIPASQTGSDNLPRPHAVLDGTRTIVTSPLSSNQTPSGGH